MTLPEDGNIQTDNRDKPYSWWQIRTVNIVGSTVDFPADKVLGPGWLDRKFFGGPMIQTSKFLQLMLPLKSIELLIFLGRGDILAISMDQSCSFSLSWILLHPDVAHLFCSFWWPNPRFGHREVQHSGWTPRQPGGFLDRCHWFVSLPTKTLGSWQPRQPRQPCLIHVLGAARGITVLPGGCGADGGNDVCLSGKRCAETGVATETATGSQSIGCLRQDTSALCGEKWCQGLCETVSFCRCWSELPGCRWCYTATFGSSPGPHGSCWSTASAWGQTWRGHSERCHTFTGGGGTRPSESPSFVAALGAQNWPWQLRQLRQLRELRELRLTLAA